MNGPAESGITVVTAGGRHTLPATSASRLLDVLNEARIPLNAACAGNGSCGLCKVQVLAGAISPPTASEHHHLLSDELDRGWRLGCQTRLTGPGTLVVDRPRPRYQWQPIADADLRNPDRQRSQKRKESGFGIAIDLGTTRIRATLWDLGLGKRLASCGGRNPQSHFGLDILSRLEAASRGGAPLLAELVVAAIQDTILHLCSEAGIEPQSSCDIRRITIVGNTAMLMLLTETPVDRLLDTEGWSHAVELQGGDTPHWRQRWHAAPGAPIEIIPPLGGFVGSDLLAGLMAIAHDDRPNTTLLIDFGTNTELALWSGDTVLATSAPGGSALEGVGIECGMVAEPGAACRLDSEPGFHRFHASVLGDQPIIGLSGSALIDAIALLLDSGTLRPSGRFTQRDQHAQVLDLVASQTVPQEHTLSIHARDVDAIQRSKASIAAAIEVLLGRGGKCWQDIGRLYLCGLVGQHLDPGHAKAIGLIPDLPGPAIVMFGNAALTGCELALLTADGATLGQNIANRMHLFNLTQIPDYDDLFIKHLRLQPINMQLSPRLAYAQ